MQNINIQETSPLTARSESKEALQNNKLDKYKMFALKRVQRLLVKSVYRDFISILRSNIYNIRKQKNKPVWKYQKLFSKSKPSQEQKLFKTFIEHCATKIQTAFKYFICRRQYLKTMKIYQILTRWVTRVKVRLVYNCKILKTIRKRFMESYEKLEAAKLQKRQQPSIIEYNKSIRQTYFRQFEAQYKTGHWIYQRQKPEKTDNITENSRPVNFSKKVDRQILKKNSRSQSKKQQKVQQCQQQKKTNNNQKLAANQKPVINQDQRPIKPAEKYNIQEQQLRSNSFANQPNQTQNQQNQQKESKGEQPIKHKRLVKKEKYDPMKQAAEGRKRKFQKLKTQSKANDELEQHLVEQKIQKLQKTQQPNVTSVDHSLQKTPYSKKSFKDGLKNKRGEKNSERPQDKSIQNISYIKQTKSRVDCWNKSNIDYKKKKSRQEAYYQQTKDIEFNNVREFKGLPQRDVIENIEKSLKRLQQNRSRRPRGLTIEEIQKVHQDQYLKRFRKLEVRLAELAQHRSEQQMGPIPHLIVNSKYQRAATESAVSEEYFLEMEQQIIAEYKQDKLALMTIQ